jgi:hypothetical protein
MLVRAGVGFVSSSGSKSSHPSLSFSGSSSIPFSSSPQPSVDVGDVGAWWSVKSGVEFTRIGAVEGVSATRMPKKEVI